MSAVARADGVVRITLASPVRELYVRFDRDELSATLTVVRKRPGNTALRETLAFARSPLEKCRVGFLRHSDGEIAVSLWLGSASFELSGQEGKRLIDLLPDLRRTGDAP